MFELVKRSWRLGVLLALGLAILAAPALGNLTRVEAGKFTVRGCEGLFLKIETNGGAGKRVQITIGTNQITFQTDAQGKIETGCLVIPAGATQARVELLDKIDEGWPLCCTIPLSEVPAGRYERVGSCQDLAPPRTTLAVSPSPTAHGWHNGPVTVRLSSADDRSGVVKLCYTLTGATAQAEKCLSFTPTVACGAAPASGEGNFTVSREGITTVSFYGVDGWGNRETTRTGEVRIDMTKPTLTYTRDPGPNEYGWNNTDVRVVFQAQDALSGVETQPPDQVVRTEGKDQSVTGTARDKAGNTTTVTVTGISIDKTKPTVVFGDPQGTRGNAGWWISSVTVPYRVTDNLSGLLPSGQLSVADSVSTSEEGRSVYLRVTVQDLAGNIREAQAGPFQIDRTKPTLTYIRTPDPNEFGWNNTDVLVKFQASDALSGVETCTPERRVTEEGKDQSVTGTARDKAGNTTTVTVTGISIDKTKPTVRLGESQGTRGNAGWWISNVTVPYTATDELSGFAPDGRTSTSGSQSTSEEGRSVYLRVTVRDRAGNAGEAQAGPFSIDKTPPRIRLESTAEPGRAVVTWEVSDGLSGVEGGSCVVAVAGPGITGVEGWRTLSRDCSGQIELTYEAYGEGTFTVRVTARDVAGNEGAEETTVSLEQPKAVGGAVLIYYGNGGTPPGLQFEIPGVATYTRLAAHYEGAGLQTDYTDQWPSSLDGYCLIILPCPGDQGDEGENFYTSAQVAALRAFLERGGRLVVLGDHSGWFGMNTLNDLLDKIGVGIRQNSDDFLGEYYSVPTSHISSHYLMEGVTSFQFAASSSLTLSGTAESLVREPGGATLIAVDRIAGAPGGQGGEVVVSGDLNIIDDAWFDDGDGDNLKFFENLAARCAGGQPFPEVVPCAEPGGSLEQACPITLPYTGHHAIESSGDRDFFRFTLAERTRLTIEVAAKQIGSGLDSYLCLYDRNGSQITCDDDSGPDTDSLIELTLDPGTYYIEVRPYSGTGAYELRVRRSGH